MTTQYSALSALVDRCTYRPHGCPPVRLEVRERHGRSWICFTLPVSDARGNRPDFPGAKFADLIRTELTDETSLRHAIAECVATAAAHEALELLSIDGELLHDPHLHGEPIVVFAPPGAPPIGPIPSRA
jgi:hypothetical protein